MKYFLYAVSLHFPKACLKNHSATCTPHFGKPQVVSDKGAAKPCTRTLPAGVKEIV